MRIITLILCFLVSNVAYSDTLPDKNAAKNLIKSVMNNISQGKTSEGLDLIKPYLIIPESEFNVVKNNLALQQPMYDQRFGKTVGVEFIKIEEVGESLMFILYIQKFEKHMMRWSFYFI